MCESVFVSDGWWPVVLLFPGDNLDKQLLHIQRQRKGQVIKPFQGNVTDHIPSQEAATMVPPSESGEAWLLSGPSSVFSSSSCWRLTMEFLDQNMDGQIS